MNSPHKLEDRIKAKSKQLGFFLAGITSSEPLAHYAFFQSWLKDGYHGTMQYLQNEKRADPKLILPECKSILVLALPYSPISTADQVGGGSRYRFNLTRPAPPYRDHEVQIASYALGEDYHNIIPPKLQQLVQFIEEQVGHEIPNRYYTDTGPILERELAQRAGLGWIGKNSMLINPKHGSTFFLAEILLGIELEPDAPIITDHCGICTRCIQACPTQCILPNRTLDARRCISYLTIENKESIPEDLRPQLRNWIFGCDVCQQACPWNRFSAPADLSLAPANADFIQPADLTLTPVEFNRRFKQSPIQRAKRRGLLRNLAVALGNTRDTIHLPVLQQAAQDDEPLICEHAHWAIQKITQEDE